MSSKSVEPGWQQRRRMDNFNVLVSGGFDQDQDLVSDGWTDIFRNLTAHRVPRPSVALS